MDPRRPGSPQLARRYWTSDSATAAGYSRIHHGRSPSATGISNVKTNQNFAPKAAAYSLAQVMTSQTEQHDDDLVFSNTVPSPLAFARNARIGRPAISSGNKVARSPSPAVISPLPLEDSDSVYQNALEDSAAGQFRSAIRMSATLTSPASVEPALPSPIIAPLPTAPSLPPPTIWQNQNRFLATSGLTSTKVSGDDKEGGALQDELHNVQEKNVNMLEKLRVEEETCQEAEERVKQLEKQVASLSEGVSLEAKLLSRKEALLCQREEALRNAKEINNRVDDEVASLHSKVKYLKDVKAAALDQLHGAENEVKSLRSMTSRMFLSQKEMEDVVLKRCWLARYWGLAVRHGICEDVAVSRHEHWSSLAPLPFEIVLSAGQKAKEESSSNAGSEKTDRSELVRDLSDLSGDGNIESMLSVEMGLKQLSSLKVEEAIVRALSQQRRLNTVRSSQSEVSAEESEDVLFKEAWLAYFWRRAQTVGIEEHIAAERLKFWIDSRARAPTSHDAAAAVEQGLAEVRKLGIEQRLWAASRMEN